MTSDLRFAVCRAKEAKVSPIYWFIQIRRLTHRDPHLDHLHEDMAQSWPDPGLEAERCHLVASQLNERAALRVRVRMQVQHQYLCYSARLEVFR